MSVPERLDATVRGRVQGVGYRVFVLREAGYLGLAGHVANMPDGSVHVVAEGPRPDLEALLERLEEGPPAGYVDRVLTRWEPARGLRPGFRIETGARTGD
jgi:acylphosphatase